MTKITKITLIIALALAMLPGLALAKDNDRNKNRHDRDKVRAEARSEFRSWFNLGRYERNNDRDHENETRTRFISGTVTAVGNGTLTIESDTGTVYTVLVGSVQIMTPFVGTIVLADVAVNDNVYVRGTVNNENQITAKTIVVTPSNTHPAAVKGEVTAINGNNVTVQAEHRGVPYTVNVVTTASTTVQAEDDAATSTAALEVGSEVKVKGLWQELLNVLTAVKIKIFG